MKEIPENNPVVFFNKQQGRLCYRHTNNHTKFHDEEIWSPKNRFNSRNNGYDFWLVTIVVIDEFGDGYPVGWCLSNREDQFVLENFLKPIQKRIGLITPRWFMSDDAA